MRIPRAAFALTSLSRSRPPERFFHRKARKARSTRNATPATLPTTLPTTVPVDGAESSPLELPEVDVDVGDAELPPPMPPTPPSLPSPPAVVSAEPVDVLVAKVLVVLRLPVVVVVEPKDESEVDEMDESTEDVTLVEPDENRLVEVVAVRTDVEDEFVDVRNGIVEFEGALNEE